MSTKFQRDPLPVSKLDDISIKPDLKPTFDAVDRTVIPI